MYDIIIIGAGTAGLTAAIYGVRAGKTVLVLEKMMVGGQIINTKEIENYPGVSNISGAEFAMNLSTQATDLGAEIAYKEVLRIEDVGDTKKVITTEDSYEAKAVIIATGAKNRPLGVEGEEQLIGAGISYCATCDGAFFKNRDVAVVGGGNTALEDARFLSDYCKQVYVIHRRDEFRGEEELVERLKERDNIQFVLDSTVEKLNYENQLESIIVKNKKTNETTTIKVDGLFVAIGQVPDNQGFADVVDVDKVGYVVANESCKTKVPGVFVAGDCRTKTVRQLTTAASDGAIASLAACEYIR